MKVDQGPVHNNIIIRCTAHCLPVCHAHPFRIWLLVQFQPIGLELSLTMGSVDGAAAAEG